MKRDWQGFKALYGNIEGARAAFEPACESLFRKLFPGQTVQVVRANPGDEGIDILVGEIGIEPIRVFQCKFFLEQIGKTQKGEIRKSFKTSIESKQYKMSEWTLCVPMLLDISEHKWWAGWKYRTQKKHNTPIHLKNGEELIDLMKEQEIYERVFQIDRELKIDATLEKTTSIETLLKQSITPTTPLTKHAQQVKDWLTALGYAFEPELIRESSHLGWIARKGFERVFVLVMCEIIELPHAEQLAQYVERYTCSEGWIVTTLRISKAAKQEFQQINYSHLSWYTFDTLLDRDADFSGYVAWLEEQITKTGVDREYVPLIFQKSEFDPQTKKTLRTDRYDEEDDWLEGYLDRWLDEPAKKHVSILGEFGMGKTWGALHYAWRKLQHYQEAKQKGTNRPRLPLYIPLREYTNDRVELLFSKFFSRYQISLPNYAAFEQLNRFGKLLLIFDGFDEISSIVNPKEMSRHFWELARAATDNSKMILTCRNEYFPNAKEARRLLNAELRASTAYLNGESPQFEILELIPFTKPQIQQVLTQHAPAETIEKIMMDDKLVNLARRPVLIELIIEALPDIEEGKPVDMARIYLYAISRKLQRDIKEKRTKTSLFEKVYFLCELSCAMLYRYPMSLSYTTIRELIKTRLFSKKFADVQENVDSWTHDMLVQSVLIRDEEGNYTPAHRSFLDFFIAYKIAAELGLLAPNFLTHLRKEAYSNESYMETQPHSEIAQDLYLYYKVKNSTLERLSCILVNEDSSDKIAWTVHHVVLMIIHPWLHNAILDLLYEMIPFLDEAIHDRLLDILEAAKGIPFEEIKYLASNIVTLFLKHKQDFFKGKDLSHLRLNGLRCWGVGWKQVDFTNTLFQGTDLTDANLSDAILINANLRDTILNDVGFKMSELYDTLQHPHENLIFVESRSCFLLVNIHTNTIIKRIERGQTYRSILSPDKTHIVINSGNTFKFINTDTCSVVSKHTIDAPNCKEIDRVIFADSANVLICADGEESKIYFWNIRENIIIKTLDVRYEKWTGIYNLSLSQNKKYLSAETEESFQLWDIEADTAILVDLWKDAGFITGIFHPKDNHLITKNADADFIKIVDAQNMSSLKTLSSEKGELQLYFNDSGSILAAVHYDKIVLYDYYREQVISQCDIYDVENFLYLKSERSLNAHFRRHPDLTFAINNATFNENGKFIHIAAQPGYLLTYEIQTGKLHNAFAYMEHVEGADFTGSKGLKYELAQQLKGNGAIINPEDYRIS